MSLKMTSLIPRINRSAPDRTFDSTGELVNPLKTSTAPKMIILKGNRIAPKLNSAGIKRVPIKIIPIPKTMKMSPRIRLNFGVFCSASIFLLAKWEGSTKNASNKENPRQAITTNAISLIISSPSTNSRTENAIMVVSTDVNTEGSTSIVPSIAA